MAPNNDEIQSLQQSLKGDTSAFEMLIRKYQGLVCAVTFSATGHFDVSEDLAQEAFVQAWKNLAQLQDLQRFRGWLLSITRRCILNYYRSTKGHPVQSAGPEQIQDHASDRPTPEEEAISREEETMVAQALMAIPENYREPLVLFYRQQHSIKEVAEIIGQPESTVRVQLHRGRQMLKDKVEAMVDRTLSRSGPTNTFTKAVLAAVVLSAAAKSTVTAATAQNAVGGSGFTAAGSSMGMKNRRRGRIRDHCCHRFCHLQTTYIRSH